MKLQDWLHTVKTTYETSAPSMRAAHDVLTLGLTQKAAAQRHGLSSAKDVSAAFIFLRRKGVQVPKLRGQISTRVDIEVNANGRVQVEEAVKADALKMRRDGLTQTEIAERLHVAQTTVSRWERAD